MPGSNAERVALLEALIERFEVPDDGVEVPLDDGLSVRVDLGGEGFSLVTIHSDASSCITDTHLANARVVGPARWIVTGGRPDIRVDLPHDAARPLVRHALSHALELAGWPAPPLTPARRRRRLEAGRVRLDRTFQRAGVDPSRLLKLQGGLVVGFDDQRNDGESCLIAEPTIDDAEEELTYCVLHLVEDHRGVVWLRASAVTGSARREQVSDLDTGMKPVMTRQVIIDTHPDYWHGEPDVRHVVSVADLDLSDVSPKAVSTLVWAVTTFACRWRVEEWYCTTLPLIPLDALTTSPTDEPLSVVEWNQQPVLLTPRLGSTSTPSSRLDRPEPTTEDAHDESCRFHTPRTAGATGTCPSCAYSLRSGGHALLEQMHERGVVTDAEHHEIDAGLDNSVDPVRERQAETRLAVKVAQRAPIRDLTDLDIEGAMDRLAELVGTGNPTYRVGGLILDLLLVDGINAGVLLVGEVGSGKTALARHIATVLGTPCHVVPLGSTSGRHTITGSDPGFRNADRGAVIGAVAAFGTTQLLLVLDEIDKFAGHSSDNYPLASLLGLLDDQRSGFTDFFVGSEPGWQVDLTNTVFVATANDRSSIPEPVLSRMRVIDVPAWTVQEKLGLARREATRFGHELRLERPIPGDVLDFIVEQCPQPGIRELLRALEQYRSALVRAQAGGTEVDLLTLFPPAQATPVASRSRPVPPTPGAIRSVVLTPRGWQEVVCTATPNGIRWAGSIDALGADGDTFVLHWVPMLEAALGIPFPPCTLHIDPPSLGPHVAAGLSLAFLAAVTSAVTSRTPDHSTIAPLRADPSGRLTDQSLSAADVAGLVALGFDKVVLATPRQDRGIEWDRNDLPATTVATDLVDLMDRLVPGIRSKQRSSRNLTLHGYI